VVKPLPSYPALPIAERIRHALEEAGGSLTYDALAHKVFPPTEYPRAWNYATGGGPPGCFMALSAALRRHGFRCYSSGPGPGQRTVSLR